MASQHIYKVLFVNQGKVYEVYARKVGHGSLFGFVEIEELVFGERAGVVLDPAEERIKTEFEGVKRSFLPMHSVLRIDEVTKRGASKITQFEGNVTPFPSPVYAPATDPGKQALSAVSVVTDVIEQRRRDIGDLEVGRVLPHQGGRMIGPFIFFDHIGPVQLAAGLPRSVDVRPHPHIGLATLTYLFAGEIMHRDSVGSEQPILPGEVNWMTAGSGITHSERFEAARKAGGPLHGIQSWVALPDGAEEVAPEFVHLDAGQLPEVRDAGVQMRLALGTAYGLEAPARTYSPLFYAHAELDGGAQLPLPDDHVERAVYIVSGAISVAGERYTAGRMIQFTPRLSASLRADGPTTLMLLGGESVGPRFIEWNFVSSSRERIEQARSDWRAGRMKLPDLDDQEFIPLP